MKSSKTDNFDLAAKLHLRRHFLRKYHGPESGAPLPRVLDCCQGSAILWGRLRQEFPVASYLGLDVKPQKGRLRLDSRRYLALPGWDHDVIDVDTYGSPWGHWLALLPNLRGPTTVFLTVGQRVTGTVGRMGGEALKSLGLGNLGKRLPAGFHVKLAEIAVSYCLTRSYDNGIIMVDAAEAVSANPNARYLGVRLEPGQPVSKGD